MNKRDSRIKELKKLRYALNEIVRENKKKLKEVNREINRLEEEKTLQRKMGR